ncbi:AAA family ATPase [Microvirga aerophila]|uniref:non-specific protein-tyrosine kinase n=1 Tax=Microvirga aerophila TaxID=670291 RepID=A0A512C2Z6_9HYPH|nr:AAA family ATPase [Microvirga aerophila]GEO18582.1 chain-length determining protein [Microvirga aerophila]
MLNTRLQILPQVPAKELDEIEFRPSDLVGFFRRQGSTILVTVIAVLTLAGVYILAAAPTYTSTMQLIINPRKVVPFDQQARLSELAPDSTAIESQVEMLKSETVRLAVIQKLNLTRDPEFVEIAKIEHLVRKLTAFIGIRLDADQSDNELTNRALKSLNDNLTVKRVTRTYVIEASYRSRDRVKSAQIANAFADAYIAEQLKANFDAAKGTSDWLEGRLAELQNQVIRADLAVQNFIVENRLIEADSGRTLTEQQVGDANAQLTQARGQVAEAKARLDRVLAIRDDDVTSPAVTDSLNNQVITKIREQHLAAVRREADFNARYGSGHPAVIELRKDIDQLRNAARDELRRISEAYRSEYAIAKSREDALEANLRTAVSAASRGKQASVSLRMLESSALAYRKLYDSFLQKLGDFTQQQSFTGTDVRVITPARAGERSHPKILLVFGAALLVGTFGGVGVGFAREQLDRTIKTTQQVESLIGVRCFGTVPKLTSKVLRRSSAAAPKFDGGMPPRTLHPGIKLERHVLHAPYSELAETMRRIKVAADRTGSRSVVLGIVSALPGEGKSSIAANLAQLLSETGSSTLLIDGDLRRPSLTQRLSPEATTGLVQVLGTEAKMKDAIWRDPSTKLDFLPAVIKSTAPTQTMLLASSEMEALLSEVRAQYRYVVMDLPPLAPVVDAEAMRDLIDYFVLVVEWGRTELNVIQEVLQSADLIQPRILGAVLNKAEMGGTRAAGVEQASTV